MTPDVTIVMPAWRPRPGWLRAAVESVLAQRGCDVELLVVDDGSPEPVANALRDVGDARVRLVRVKHGGAAAARNAGTERATAAFIRFVDADDVLELDSTARLLGRIDGRADTVSYGATVVCDQHLRPLGTLSSSLDGDVAVACLLGRFHVRHVSMVFPRAVVDRAGGWTSGFSVSEDWDFTLRALEHATVRSDSLPATYYRRHGHSRTGAASVAAGEDDRRLIIERFLERHPDLRGTSVERDAFTEMHLDRALAYAHIGETRLALERVARGARGSPGRALVTGARVLRRGVRQMPVARRGRPDARS